MASSWTTFWSWRADDRSSRMRAAASTARTRSRDRATRSRWWEAASLAVRSRARTCGAGWSPSACSRAVWAEAAADSAAAMAGPVSRAWSAVSAAPHDVLEVDGLEVLHDHRGPPVDRREVHDIDDVPMPKQTEQPGFVPHASGHLIGIRPLRLQQLHGHQTREAVRVHHLRQVHGAETT